jgi:hypothetical protein
MVSAIALIGMIGAIKAFFAWAVCGCSISLVASPIQHLWLAVYLSTKWLLAGALLSAFKCVRDLDGGFGIH